MKSQTKKTSYRPDIDGLRALAVIAVIIFHINPNWLPGGFIGVDIFFVISGFLITTILLKKKYQSIYQLADFYNRRLKRLFPVLVIVILSCLIVGQLIYTPSDYIKLFESSIWSIFSSANLYFTFFSGQGYFDDSAKIHALKHLWSLGVEEQFYIFIPMAFVFSVSYLHKRIFVYSLVTLAAVSFIFAQFYFKYDPDFSYYMLPTRMGQLLIGAILSWLFLFVYNKCEGRDLPLTNFLGLTGLILVVASLFFINSASVYPGILALPVSIGTAMIIYAGSSATSYVTRFFSFKPFVFIGLLSYSLYLWHWPIIVFYKYYFGELEMFDVLIVLAMIITLSVFSYFLVEERFRHTNYRIMGTAVRYFVCPSLTVIILYSGIIYTDGKGIASFASSDTLKIKSGGTYSQTVINPAPSLGYVCQEKLVEEKDVFSQKCIVNSISEPKILMWGDSNSSHYVPAMKKLASNYHFSFRNIAHSSCPPILKNLKKITSLDKLARCKESAENVFSIIESYDVVFLSASWDSYIDKQDFSQSLKDTIKMIQNRGVRPIIIGRIPRIIGFDKDCEIKKSAIFGSKCSYAQPVPYQRTHSINQSLKKIVAVTGAEYLDFNFSICDKSYCSHVIDYSIVYYDSGHLNSESGNPLAQSIIDDGRYDNLFSELSEISPSQNYDYFTIEDALNADTFLEESFTKVYSKSLINIIDDSKTSYISETVYTISPPESDLILVKINVGSYTGNPLFRVKLKSRSNAKKSDFMFYDDNEIDRRGKSDDVSLLEIKNNDEVISYFFAINSNKNITNIELLFFGGVLSNDSGYTTAAEGSIYIDSLEVWTLDTNNSLAESSYL